MRLILEKAANLGYRDFPRNTPIAIYSTARFYKIQF
jgi:hypothetical protein